MALTGRSKIEIARYFDWTVENICKREFEFITIH